MKKLIYWLFGKPLDIPPWIKSTREGRLFIDKTNRDYIRFYKAKIDYLTQWSLKDGKMVFDNNKGLSEPNIKDYYDKIN